VFAGGLARGKLEVMDRMELEWERIGEVKGTGMGKM